MGRTRKLSGVERGGKCLEKAIEKTGVKWEERMEEGKSGYRKWKTENWTWKMENGKSDTETGKLKIRDGNWAGATYAVAGTPFI